MFSVWRSLSAGILVAILAGLAHSLADVLPDLKVIAFSRPSAHITALFLSGIMETAGDSYIIRHPRLDLAVIPACSGFSFWLVFTSFFAWEILRGQSPGRGRLLALLLPLGYLTALAVNIARLLAVWHSMAAIGALAPASWRDPLHALTGMAVTLPVLILSRTLFLHWRLTHAYPAAQIPPHRVPARQPPRVPGADPRLSDGAPGH